MNIAGHGLTDNGKQRNYNEDFMLLDPALGLYVVCDGMGGHAAGDFASRYATQTIQAVVAQNKEILTAVTAGQQPIDRAVALMRHAIETACSMVYDEGVRDVAKRGMGCTCTAVILVAGKAILGHVGDSRLYLGRGGTATQISEDHSFVAEAVKSGLFTPEEAANMAFKNVLTRAIGKDRSVKVDTLVFDLILGDTLLLCSDGLHQYTRDLAELGTILSHPSPEGLPKKLVGLANERGGSDNVTALIIRAQDDADGTAAQRSNDVSKNLGALQRLELMKDLSMAELIKLAQIFQEIHLQPGQVVVREGDVSDWLFVIAQGAAEVIRGGHSIAVLPAGAHFGEMSLLNSRPRSATVRVVEPTRLLGTDKAHFYGLLQQDGMLAAKVFWKLAETLSRRLEDVLAQQAAQKTVQEQGHLSGMYNKPQRG